VVKRD